MSSSRTTRGVSGGSWQRLVRHFAMTSDGCTRPARRSFDLMSMLLQGQQCTSLRWRLNDAEHFVAHANNLNVARHLRDRFPHPYTLSDAHQFLRSISPNGPHTNFAIEVDGRAVGGLGYVAG